MYNAVLTNNREIIEIFLQNNYDLDVPLKLLGDAKKNAVQLAFERGHLDLLRLFEQLGFVMNSWTTVENTTVAVAVRRFLTEVETVPSLRKVCRKAIRKSLGTDIQSIVLWLPLPPCLRNYLLLEDVFHIYHQPATFVIE